MIWPERRGKIGKGIASGEMDESDCILANGNLVFYRTVIDVV